MQKGLTFLALFVLASCAPAAPRPAPVIVPTDRTITGLLNRIGRDTFVKLDAERVPLFVEGESMFRHVGDPGESDLSPPSCFLTKTETRMLKAADPDGYSWSCRFRTTGGMLAVGEKVTSTGDCNGKGGSASIVLSIVDRERVSRAAETTGIGPSGCPCPTMQYEPFEIYRADVDDDHLTDLVIASDARVGKPTLRVILGFDTGRVAITAEPREKAKLFRSGQKIFEVLEEENKPPSYRVLGASGFVNSESTKDLERSDRERSAATLLSRLQVGGSDRSEVRDARKILGI